MFQNVEKLIFYQIMFIYFISKPLLLPYFVLLYFLQKFSLQVFFIRLWDLALAFNFLGKLAPFNDKLCHKNWHGNRINGSKFKTGWKFGDFEEIFLGDVVCIWLRNRHHYLVCIKSLLSWDMIHFQTSNKFHSLKVNVVKFHW